MCASRFKHGSSASVSWSLMLYVSRGTRNFHGDTVHALVQNDLTAQSTRLFKLDVSARSSHQAVSLGPVLTPNAKSSMSFSSSVGSSNLS